MPLVPGGRQLRTAVSTAAAATLLATALVAGPVGPDPDVRASGATITSAPPRWAGYFSTKPVGAWRSLPSGYDCRSRVRRSTWEPRPHNRGPNHTRPDATAVRAAFAARPLSGEGTYNTRWDTWLLRRVAGQYTGTTDEIFQWAACKWGISDNLLRAVAVRESTWYQYEVYPSGRCVTNWGCGDMVGTPTPATRTYCAAIGRAGHDYEADYGDGRCPKTFSIAGVMSWRDPSWGQMRGNQNGTFPFNRDSTAFALDFLASYLRGCYEGWVYWLDDSGPTAYNPGDIWGCVGSWYAGEWRTDRALGYMGRVRNELVNRTWLRAGWRDIRPSCSPTYGCPRGS